jgi:hypothetical protein
MDGWPKYVIALEQLPGRFNLAPGIGAAGFSTGMGVHSARTYPSIGAGERSHQLAQE